MLFRAIDWRDGEIMLKLLALVALCVVAVGCVPCPAKSMVHYGVEGQLRDAASGMPIGRRHVFVVVDGRKFDRTTNRRGEFKVAPEMRHFWTWLGGPWCMDAPGATLEISLDDYALYQRTFVVRSTTFDAPVTPDQRLVRGRCLMLGDIIMKKRDPEGSGKGSPPTR